MNKKLDYTVDQYYDYQDVMYELIDAAEEREQELFDEMTKYDCEDSAIEIWQSWEEASETIRKWWLVNKRTKVV